MRLSFLINMRQIINRVSTELYSLLTAKLKTAKTLRNLIRQTEEIEYYPNESDTHNTIYQEQFP